MDRPRLSGCAAVISGAADDFAGAVRARGFGSAFSSQMFFLRFRGYTPLTSISL
jgi:hypothetical protein